MYAVEFETDAKRDIIVIPKQYKKFFSKHIKIIAMINEEKVNFDANLDIDNLKRFSEETINTMKMQETSSFVKNILGSPEEDIWNDLKPYPNISQEF